MLEKPDIPDERIVSGLQDEYGIHVAQPEFLPLGADTGSAVFRVVADDGALYFLKLRKGFAEIVVTVPLFLKSQGIQAILPPFETRAGQGWADFGEYTMILYPFVEGKNGFQIDLTGDHKRVLGAALREIHSTNIPPGLRTVIPQETFPPRWRNCVKELQSKAEHGVFADPAAAKLARFMRSRQIEIRRLIRRTEELASELKPRAHEQVLCHTDIHGANILITAKDELYIVDWDAPLLAPRERDLMFVGGGIDTLWKDKLEEAVFYEGYGEVQIDFSLMAYYRYERVIEDLAAYGEQLLSTQEGGADREEACEQFIANFEPGQTIEIAGKTDRLGQEKMRKR